MRELNSRAESGGSGETAGVTRSEATAGRANMVASSSTARFNLLVDDRTFVTASNGVIHYEMGCNVSPADIPEKSLAAKITGSSRARIAPRDCTNYVPAPHHGCAAPPQERAEQFQVVSVGAAQCSVAAASVRGER